MGPPNNRCSGHWRIGPSVTSPKPLAEPRDPAFTHTPEKRVSAPGQPPSVRACEIQAIWVSAVAELVSGLFDAICPVMSAARLSCTPAPISSTTHPGRTAVINQLRAFLLEPGL